MLRWAAQSANHDRINVPKMKNPVRGCTTRNSQPRFLLVKFGSSSVFSYFRCENYSDWNVCLTPPWESKEFVLPIPTTSYGTSNGDHWASDKHGSRLCSRSCWVQPQVSQVPDCSKVFTSHFFTLCFLYPRRQPPFWKWWFLLDNDKPLLK